MYPLTIVGDTDRRGTEVRFLPDPEIFEETVFDFALLKQRLREMAFLTRNLKIVLTDLREEEPVSLTFHYEGGIKEYVEYLNKQKEVLYPDVIYCEGKKGDVYVEVAMQHNDSYNEGVYSFVNNITTPEGGTHLAGDHTAGAGAHRPDDLMRHDRAGDPDKVPAQLFVPAREVGQPEMNPLLKF